MVYQIGVAPPWEHPPGGGRLKPAPFSCYRPRPVAETDVLITQDPPARLPLSPARVRELATNGGGA